MAKSAQDPIVTRESDSTSTAFLNLDLQDMSADMLDFNGIESHTARQKNLLLQLNQYQTPEGDTMLGNDRSQAYQAAVLWSSTILSFQA